MVPHEDMATTVLIHEAAYTHARNEKLWQE